MARTVTEIEADIVLVDSAIRRILLLGAETENDSGGSKRKNREAELNDMRKLKKDLEQELSAVKRGGGGLILKAGW